MAVAGTASPPSDRRIFVLAFAAALGIGIVLSAGLVAYAVIVKPAGTAPAASAPLAVTLTLPAQQPVPAPQPVPQDTAPEEDIPFDEDESEAALEDIDANETEIASTPALPEPASAPQAVAANVDGVSEPFGSAGATLPRIRTADGMTPFTAYRRAYDAAILQKPVLSFVALDSGLSDARFTALLDKLPADVALAFTPYRDTRAQSKTAREKGFETWLTLPLEPRDFPNTDPGPNALFVDVADEENIHNLRAVLSKGDGYVGLMPLSDSPFLTSPGDMTAVVDELAARGLAFTDAGFAVAGDITPYARAKKMPHVLGRSFRIPAAAGSDAITQTLDRALAGARANGYAVVYFTPYPALLDVLANFFTALPGKDVALAPLSLVAEKSGAPAP